jgi:hypothetical protein
LERDHAGQNYSVPNRRPARRFPTAIVTFRDDSIAPAMPARPRQPANLAHRVLYPGHPTPAQAHPSS